MGPQRRRWTVTARHPDGSTTVSHLAGHSRVVLPADYVNQEISLANALTVHKAQGVTVDRAMLIANEATTTQALYVGMTRGRHHNTALVVCDQLDDEHRPTPPTAAEVLTAALGRVSAEHAALDTLRATLAASSARRLRESDSGSTRQPSLPMRPSARDHPARATRRPLH